VPRHSKTVSAVLAASLVSVAAAVTSLASLPDGTGEAMTVAALPSGPVTSSASSSSSGAVGGGRRTGHPPALAGRGVLFLGRSPELRLRGGVAKSFACRAVAKLGGTCQVREGAAPVIPASVDADVVVVLLVPADDAAQVSRLLDRLPAGLDARLVLLGPITASTDPAATRRFAGVRRLAATRGVVVVDPVAAEWIGPQQRRTYLTANGSQLTAAGRTYVAGRLADALGAVAAG
jgi:hypothetical protein